MLRDGEWRCANPGLEQRLNELTARWILETGGPAPWSKDPEREVAEAIASQTGGRVVRHAPVTAAEGARDYFPLRQYRFDFQ